MPHCHRDAFNCLQYGLKRWILYEADQEVSPKGWEIQQQCYKEYYGNAHSYDWFAHGLEETQRTGITLYECEQQAGDIVYIPKNFSHAVLNLAANQGLVVVTDRPSKVYRGTQSI